MKKFRVPKLAQPANPKRVAYKAQPKVTRKANPQLQAMSTPELQLRLKSIRAALGVLAGTKGGRGITAAETEKIQRLEAADAKALRANLLAESTRLRAELRYRLVIAV